MEAYDRHGLGLASRKQRAVFQCCQPPPLLSTPVANVIIQFSDQRDFRLTVCDLFTPHRRFVLLVHWRICPSDVFGFFWRNISASPNQALYPSAPFPFNLGFQHPRGHLLDQAEPLLKHAKAQGQKNICHKKAQNSQKRTQSFGRELRSRAAAGARMAGLGSGMLETAEADPLGPASVVGAYGLLMLSSVSFASFSFRFNVFSSSAVYFCEPFLSSL